MEAYLFIDFGSTYTKLTAVAKDQDVVLATAKAHTTVDTDVALGYESALRDLKAALGENTTFTQKLACSSAAGGLKIVAIGLVPELTAEAAKRAALGAGARVIGVYSFKLNRKEMLEIEGLGADMILLAGGTDGGNSEVILHNAALLKEAALGIPIVVAGNKSCSDQVLDLFCHGDAVHVTENVMPSLNHINVDPARETIRGIFMRRIIQARGMEGMASLLDGILMPTPAAVLKAAEVLSKGTRREEGWGDLAVIDIGGATTDVHSVAEGAPSKPSVLLRGLEEPHAKRTVEGDLGMRYSALSLMEAAQRRHFKRYGLDPGDASEAAFLLRHQDPAFVAVKPGDVAFDETMAKICVDISMHRHVGKVTAMYSPLGMMYAQEGKDLLELPVLIGTGGILVNAARPGEILAAGFAHPEEPEVLKPLRPRCHLDKDYILSAMGLLSMVDEDKALRMMKKYIVTC